MRQRNYLGGCWRLVCNYMTEHEERHTVRILGLHRYSKDIKKEEGLCLNWHCKGSIRYYRYLDSQKKYLYMPLQLGCFLFFRRLTIYISPANAVLPFFITWLLLTPFVYQAGRGKQKKEALQKKEVFQRSSITHLSLYCPKLLIITEISLQLKEMKDDSQGLHEHHQKTQTVILFPHFVQTLNI